MADEAQPPTPSDGASQSPAATSTTPAENGEMISFTVRLVGAGDDLKYTMADSTPVEQLRERISKEEPQQTPPDRIRLIVRGRIIKDGRSLKEENVADGLTINCVRTPKPKAPAAKATPKPAANPASTSRSHGGRAAGLAGGFGPASGAALDAGFGPDLDSMGFGPNDFDPSTFGPIPTAPILSPDALSDMLNNDGFRTRLSEVIQNPQFQQLISNDPHMSQMNSVMTELFQTPDLLRALMDPSLMRILTSSRARGRAAGGADMTAIAEAMGAPPSGTPRAIPPEQREAMERINTVTEELAHLLNLPSAQAAAQGDRAGQTNPATGGNAANVGSRASRPGQAGLPAHSLALPSMDELRAMYEAAFANNPEAFSRAAAALNQSTPGLFPPSSLPAGSRGQNVRPSMPANPFGLTPGNAEDDLLLQQLLGGMVQEGEDGEFGPIPGSERPSRPTESVASSTGATAGGSDAAGAPPTRPTAAAADDPVAQVIAANQGEDVNYDEQLAQLNAMGFYDRTENLAALTRALGNLGVAISFLVGELN